MKLSLEKGFTLIELLVVLTITMTLIAIVGPLTIDSFKKAEAKTELAKFRKLVKHTSYNAFIRGKSLGVYMEGKRVQVRNDEEILSSIEFEHLFFYPDAIVFSHKGFASFKEVTLSINGQEQQLQIGVSLDVTGN